MVPEPVAQLSTLVRSVPDFPKPGIVFRDITPLLADSRGFGSTVELLARRIEAHDATELAAIEARGFLFGAALAMRLGLPLQLIRKPGKLPWQTVGIDYQLEYGTDRLEMHRDAAGANARVAVVDDVLATGGTATAAVRLVESLGARVCCVAAAVELQALGARARLGGIPVETLLVYA